MSKPSPFRSFKSSPEIIRLAVMLYVRFPLSLRNVEGLLHERGVDVSHEAVGFWCAASGRCSPRRSAKGRAERLRSGRSGDGTWLPALGIVAAAQVFQTTLEEEKVSDEKLTALAEQRLNRAV
jgi:hypothetical protein